MCLKWINKTTLSKAAVQFQKSSCYFLKPNWISFKTCHRANLGPIEIFNSKFWHQPSARTLHHVTLKVKTQEPFSDIFAFAAFELAPVTIVMWMQIMGCMKVHGFNLSHTHICLRIWMETVQKASGVFFHEGCQSILLSVTSYCGYWLTSKMRVEMYSNMHLFIFLVVSTKWCWTVVPHYMAMVIKQSIISAFIFLSNVVYF